VLNKIVRLNMSTLEVSREKISGAYQMLAGRALTSRIIFDQVPPTADPLGAKNKLVIACGLLAGTGVPSSNRLSIGAKSPLTGGIKESNAGGIAAFRMARLDIRAIIVEGRPDSGHKYALVIDKDGARLEMADDLSMLGTYEKASRIYERYGKNVGVILIGPAGERQQLTAGITNNDLDGSPGRYCGRGGLGAVMGSKALLAVILDDTGVSREKAVHHEEFKNKVQEIVRWIKETPQTAEGFPKYGTAAMLNNTNAIGALPTRNFSTGTFEGADKINGYAVHDTIVSRGGAGTPTHACMPGCPIRCSNIFPGKDGRVIVAPLEYETIGLVGSNCGIDDLDTIAEINYICNDYGVDTIDVGAAMGVAMEAGIISFGDGAAALGIAKEMVRDTPLGKIIASGAVVAGRVFGVRRIPAVKGQAIPAYDPRAMKGLGVTYATSPMGADHTAGNTSRVANIKHHLKEGQVKASKDAQLGAVIFDSMGICIMLGPALKDRSIIAGLVSHRYGMETTLDHLMEMAGETLSLEKEFNRRAGFLKAHDRLPEFFYEEVNPASGTVFDIFEEDLEK